MTRYEQETIILYNAGEQTATVYTRDKSVMRKLDTLVADYPDIYSRTAQDEVSKTYSLLKSYISYRKPRTISLEQKEQARKYIEQINSNKIFENGKNDHKINERNAKLTR